MISHDFGEAGPTSYFCCFTFQSQKCASIARATPWWTMASSLEVAELRLRGVHWTKLCDRSAVECGAIRGSNSSWDFDDPSRSSWLAPCDEIVLAVWCKRRDQIRMLLSHAFESVASQMPLRVCSSERRCRRELLSLRVSVFVVCETEAPRPCFVYSRLAVRLRQQ